MKTKIVVFLCLMVISCRIVLAEREANGYFYNNPKTPQNFDLSQIGPQQSHPQQFLQAQLTPPQQQQQLQLQLQLHQQQQSNTLGSSYFEKGQLSLPNNFQNPTDSALHKQPFNQPALNFGLPTEQQHQHLNNINYSPPPQKFNSHPAENNVMRLQFEISNENQGNSIEQGCNPEPIVGQFKPELVDLANGGPLTRMITTCGPDANCKTIALQSDLNRVLAVLPRQNHNQNRLQQGGGGQQGYNQQIEGRGNSGSFINADAFNSLVRPPNRRLIQYTEIPQDDFYN